MRWPFAVARNRGAEISQQQCRGLQVIGINFWEDCGACAGVSYPVLGYPNISVRINDWLFNYMLS
jgi:hypothetical protein